MGADGTYLYSIESVYFLKTEHKKNTLKKTLLKGVVWTLQTSGLSPYERGSNPANSGSGGKP